MAKNNSEQLEKEAKEDDRVVEDAEEEAEADGDEGDNEEGEKGEGDPEAGEAETEAPEVTVYQLAVKHTGLEFDDDEYDTIDEYKAAVCRNIGKFTDDAFEALPDVLTDWQTETAKVIKTNRSKPKGERKKALPVMPGLPGEKETKAGKAAKGSKKKEKEKKPKREASENNRYYKIAQVMIKNPTADLEHVAAAAKKAGLDYNEVTLGYCFQAFRGIHLALKQANKLAH